MAGTTFQYLPLKNPRTIRLLKLVPNKLEGVVYELLHVDINRALPYVAISYTWGHPNDRTCIKVGEEYLEISRNLEEPLAYHRIEHSDICLWADSICINQSDLVERSSQIRLMKSIFERAEWVSAWLGPATPETDLAIEKVGEWHRYIEGLKELHDYDHEAVITAVLQASNILHGPSGSPTYKAWSAIQHLCQRSWWSRAWIIQEATTPKPLRIHCGTAQFVNFEAFTSVNFIARTIMNQPGLHVVKHFDRGETNQLFMLQFARIRNSSPTFLQLLQLFRRCECTNPRDRVYAALGILSEVAKVDIIPDYSRKVEDVYLDVVRYVLKHYPEGHRLDFLGYVMRSKNNFRDRNLSEGWMPSWSPDWRVRIVGDTVPTLFHQDYEIHRDIHNDAKARHWSSRTQDLTQYRASGGLPTCAVISGHILTVRGLCVDVVSEIILVSGHEQFLRNLQGRALQNLESSYPTGEPN
jgi:hypothetical protein